VQVRQIFSAPPGTHTLAHVDYIHRSIVLKRGPQASSQVNTLPIAKSQTRSKQNKDMHKCSSVYSERGVLLPVLKSGGE